MAMNYSLYVLALACILMNMISPAHLQGYEVPPDTKCPPDTKSPPDTNGPTPTASPPNGYKLIPGHGYYKFHPQLEVWHLAYDVCRWERAHLFIANSESEAKNVSKLAISAIWFWIGTCDLFDEGNYVTIFNQTEKEAGYNTYVSTSEPTESPSENCGIMQTDGLLLNIWCDAKLPFMCEYIGH